MSYFRVGCHANPLWYTKWRESLGLDQPKMPLHRGNSPTTLNLCRLRHNLPVSYALERGAYENVSPFSVEIQLVGKCHVSTVVSRPAV